VILAYKKLLFPSFLEFYTSITILPCYQLIVELRNGNVVEPTKALLKHDLILANISASDMQNSNRIFSIRLFPPDQHVTFQKK